MPNLMWDQRVCICACVIQPRDEIPPSEVRAGKGCKTDAVDEACAPAHGQGRSCQPLAYEQIAQVGTAW